MTDRCTAWCDSKRCVRIPGHEGAHNAGDGDEFVEWQDARVDMVNRPPHYSAGIEPIDAIESWGLGFCLGNAVKYIARAEHKSTALQDLQKARWYLDREIARITDDAPAPEAADSPSKPRAPKPS